MAKTKSRVNDLDEVDYVIDADSHTWEVLKHVSHIDDRYSWAKRMLEHATMSSVFQRSTPTPEFGIRHMGRIGKYLDSPDQEYDLDVKLREMEDYGIDYAIIDPGHMLDSNTVTNTQFAVALMNGYNSWILDQIQDKPFKATMVVTTKDPHASAEEIERRASEDDIVGIQMPGSGIEPPPGDHTYDPIYEAAESYGLPVTFHGSIGSTTYSWPTVGKQAETLSETLAVEHPMTAMWNLTTLIFRGVPERFPDLDIVIQEAGLGWIPYMTWRLDDLYLENEEEMVLVDKPPREYIDEQFYFTTQPLGHTAENPSFLADIIRMVGPESIMYSCDLPHPDHDPPQELFDRIKHDFDAEQVQMMMGGNAIELYGLSI